jgi:DNA-binding MarR family transcriptional regulator
MAATRVRGLTPVELDMWRSFLRAHARVIHALDAELAAECDLPLGSYEVLLHLNDAPARRLRMTELADRVLLSRSGLTRLVDRLEREGLIRRESCPTDARGTNAVLTDEGRARLKAAAPVHLRGVREHVIGMLAEDEVATLAELLGRLAGDSDALPDDRMCGGS